METVSELLLRWRELRRQGQPCSAEALCAEHPDLTDELRHHIEAVEAMERRLGPVLAGPLLDGQPTTVVTTDGTAPRVADAPTVPGYELLDVLGEGGMGVVYRARQTSLKRVVALKMVRAGTPPDQQARFRVEAEALAHARHPNIIEIYEIGEAAGRPYFTMELVEGGSLARPLARGPLPAQEAARLVLTLAEAIHAAHRRGIIHRDLKPANILLQDTTGTEETETTDKTGKHPSLSVNSISSTSSVVGFLPKITDFGLAKRLEQERGQTHSGTVLGTPAYMAPEQASGKARAVGPAADVYALGAVLFECLTGRPPFVGDTAMGILLQVVSKEPVSPGHFRPEVPQELETVCLKCLEKDPKNRYLSAAALADDLRRFLDARPIRARRPTRLARGIRWARRRPGVVLLVAVLVLAPLGLALAGWFRPATRSPSAQAVALAPQARAILLKYCFPCHGQNPEKVQKKLHVLDHGYLIGSKRGLIVPGDAPNSWLLTRIEDNSMPPEEAEDYPRLSSDEIEVLKTWVDGGAPPFDGPSEDDLRPPVEPVSPLAVEVKKIFRANCYDCHRLGKAKHGIKILNHDLLVVKRKVIVPGKPDESLLFRLLVSEDSKKMMPPEDRERVSDREIDTIRRWIEKGAPPFPRKPWK
jgi:serine/threonine protein kinase/mono/diheme cytochrome c family protein